MPVPAKRVSSGNNNAGGSSVKDLRMAFGDKKEEQNADADADADAEEDRNDADKEMVRSSTVVKIDLDRNPSAAPVGEVIYSGILDFKAAKGKATDDIVWEFSRLSPLKGIPVSLVASSSTSVHAILVTAAGDVFAWGRGGQGQLGIGDTPEQVAKPTLVTTFQGGGRVVGAATGSSHTLVLTGSGDVFGFGSNNFGQLGLGHFDPIVPTPAKMLSKKIFVKVSCGADFSMIADSKGYLYSCGYAENGRLGHGNPKEIIEGPAKGFENENRARRMLRFVFRDPKSSMTKDLDDAKIVDVQCGAQHSIALDDQGRVFTWGFGGYGRLGHGSPADEVFPRLVNTFLGERRTAKRIWAGGSVSFALNEVGTFMCWGWVGSNRDNITYPKTLDAMRKKAIKAVAVSNNAVLVKTDEDLYTWSFGATLGQMGLGADQKSSADALRVPLPPLPPGVEVLSLSCGHSFSFCLVGRSGSDGKSGGSDRSGKERRKGPAKEKELTVDGVVDAFPSVELGD